MKLKISRKTNIILNFLINDCMPPFLRDCGFIMKPAFKILFGDKAHLFYNFHEKCYSLSDEEFAELNREIQDVIIDRATDLNEECIKQIEFDVSGNVLEVGCGRGFLAENLSKKHDVTAVDVALSKDLPKDTKVKYIEASSEKLPFEDKSFDTVISAHTLEHVRDIQKTISELRRVCRKKLIIVLPCERPYKYSFNLHIHFFPYEYNIHSALGKKENSEVKKLGGDWYYVENI